MMMAMEGIRSAPGLIWPGLISILLCRSFMLLSVAAAIFPANRGCRVMDKNYGSIGPALW
jgi:hypothetical protein